MSEDQELSIRISALENHIDGLYSLLRRASQFSSSEPQMALNQCRVVLERLIYKWYQNETHKVIERPLLGAMLNDKEFVSKIPRHILPKIIYVKDYGNLASHGEEIDSKTADDVVHKLLDVLEWFTNNPSTEDILLHRQFDNGNTVYLEILPQLREVYPNCLTPELEFVRFGQDKKSCYIEVITSETNGAEIPQVETGGIYKVIMDRQDLDFIGEFDFETDEIIRDYDPKNSLNENVKRFISDLQTICNVADLFTQEAAERVKRNFENMDNSLF